MINDIASLVSLFLTAPTVIFAIAVVFIWGKESIEFLKKSERTPMEWLVLGVTVSFAGSIIDNLYWASFWSFTYYSNYLSETLSQIGVCINVFFRQGCGILAAYCHLKSYTELKKDSNLNKNLWISSSIFGAIYVTMLYFFTGNK